MFRKFACILSAAGILLTFRISAQAAGETVIQYPKELAGMVFLWEGTKSFLEPGGNVLTMDAAAGKLPDTGDYPAPIFTAMLLSMGVVIVLVMTEDRRK